MTVTKTTKMAELITAPSNLVPAESPACVQHTSEPLSAALLCSVVCSQTAPPPHGSICWLLPQLSQWCCLWG